MVSVHKSPPPTAPPAYDQPPAETYSQPPPPPPPPPPPATGLPVHIQHSPIQNNVGGNNWSSGLCDCFSDCSICCMTCWCPCITFGQIAEIVDRGSSSCIANGALYCLLQHVTGCACLYSCFYRSKMRRQYDLKEGPCGDCLVHFCCECCALCQESRELKRRGFDLSIGWQGNIEKQNQGITPPFAQQGMYR